MRALALVLSAIVLGAVAPAQDGTLRPEHQEELRVLQPKIDKAIDQGVQWLLSQQQRDGSWSAYREAFNTGQTALSAYTLMKCGLSPEHPSIVRAIEHLRWREPERIYAMGAQMLALAETRGNAHHDRMRDVVRSMILLQDGSWDYPNRDGALKGHHQDRDLSITQFALLGFRAAKKAGIKVPNKVLRDAFDDVLQYQESPKDGPDGEEIAGFWYHRDGRARAATGSMTTAGVACLMIAAEILGDDLGRKRSRLLEDASRWGQNWLAAHFSIDENPKKGKSWLHYYLYGMERVGALLGTEYLGAHPWYLEGAKFLVEKQGGGGAWHSSNYECDTCFALLFLKRATMPTTGGGSTTAALTIDTDGAADPKVPPPGAVGFAATGGNDGRPMQFWLQRVKDRSAKDAVTKAAGLPTLIRGVDYLVDDEVVATRDLPTPSAWPSDAFVAEHMFTRRGKYRVQARVRTATGPEADATPGPVLLSETVKVQIDHVLEPWMLEAAGAARSRNLLAKTTCRSTASSAADKYGPERAHDLDEYTDWRFTKDDATPTLTLILRKRQRADQIVLHQAEGRAAHRGALDRIRKLRIEIDKDDPFEFDVEGDELAPIVIPLTKRRQIKRLVLTVVERESGKSQPGVGGITEVALQSLR